MQERGIQWLATELMVYHPNLLYAGQVDAIGVVDGEVTLFDWKTTDGLDKRGKRKTLGQVTHAAQVGGYWFAMHKQKDTTIPLPTRLVICYVLKDTLEVEWRYVKLPDAAGLFMTAIELHDCINGGLYE